MRRVDCGAVLRSSIRASTRDVSGLTYMHLGVFGGVLMQVAVLCMSVCTRTIDIAAPYSIESCRPWCRSTLQHAIGRQNLQRSSRTLDVLRTSEIGQAEEADGVFLELGSPQMDRSVLPRCTSLSSLNWWKLSLGSGFVIIYRYIRTSRSMTLEISKREASIWTAAISVP